MSEKIDLISNIGCNVVELMEDMQSMSETLPEGMEMHNGTIEYDFCGGAAGITGKWKIEITRS